MTLEQIVREQIRKSICPVTGNVIKLIQLNARKKLVLNLVAGNNSVLNLVAGKKLV